MKKVFYRILQDINSNKIPLLILSALLISFHLVFRHICPMVILTGFPCPGCGLTRAFLLFFSLHPLEAFTYNPAYPLWLLMFIIFFVKRYILGKKLSSLFKYSFLAVVIITIAVYIFRMSHFFPGSEPLVYYDGNIMARIHPEFNQFVRGRIQ